MTTPEAVHVVATVPMIFEVLLLLLLSSHPRRLRAVCQPCLKGLGSGMRQRAPLLDASLSQPLHQARGEVQHQALARFVSTPFARGFAFDEALCPCRQVSG